MHDRIGAIAIEPADKLDGAKDRKLVASAVLVEHSKIVELELRTNADEVTARLRIVLHMARNNASDMGSVVGARQAIFVGFLQGNSLVVGINSCHRVHAAR